MTMFLELHTLVRERPTLINAGEIVRVTTECDWVDVLERNVEHAVLRLGSEYVAVRESYEYVVELIRTITEVSLNQ